MIFVVCTNFPDWRLKLLEFIFFGFALNLIIKIYLNAENVQNSLTLTVICAIIYKLRLSG